MSDTPSDDCNSHITQLLDEPEMLMIGSHRDYLEFLRIAAIAIQQGRHPRLVEKLYKEILEHDDPRGLRIDEMGYAINLIWRPVGQVIIRKIVDPRVFIFRFTNAQDFATSIMTNPSRIHGKLLTLRILTNTQDIQDIDFSLHDFWVRFTLRRDLAARGVIARMVAQKIGKVISLTGPIDEEGGIYKAHVLVDVSVPLKHLVKVEIVDGDNKEVVNVRSFFLSLPHGSCRRCWVIDHTRVDCTFQMVNFRRNPPRVVFHEDVSVAEMIRNERRVSGTRNLGTVARAVSAFSIYDSDIDRQERMNKSNKRIRMDIDGDQEEEAQSSERTITEDVQVNDQPRRVITHEDLRTALKGKGKMHDMQNGEGNSCGIEASGGFYSDIQRKSGSA